MLQDPSCHNTKDTKCTMSGRIQGDVKTWEERRCVFGNLKLATRAVNRKKKCYDIAHEYVTFSTESVMNTQNRMALDAFAFRSNRRKKKTDFFPFKCFNTSIRDELILLDVNEKQRFIQNNPCSMFSWGTSRPRPDELTPRIVGM